MILFCESDKISRQRAHLFCRKVCRSPLLIDEINDAVEAVTQAHWEASKVFNLYLLDSFEKAQRAQLFPELPDFDETFFRQLYTCVGR